MLQGSTNDGAGMTRLTAAIGLGVLLGLGGCAPMDRYVGGAFESVATLGGTLGAPWGTTRPRVIEGGSTVARVRAGGGMGGEEVLTPEEGNVWPAAEGPRATLANPDEALRGIPTYRPGVDPAAAQPPVTDRSRRPPRGSGNAFDALPTEPAPPVASSPPRLAPTRPPLAGGVITAPDGSTRVITGGNGQVGSTVGPGGQTGTLLRDGNVQILQEPGRPAQQIITPR